jgi:anaerobic selenocysteine-containing dehydrogenase
VPTAWFGADVSPLMTKLWVESDLKPSVQLVYMHPETAHRLALADGTNVRIETACGACQVEVRVDDTVQTGALEMAAGQAWLALGELKDGAWRAAAPRMVRL